MKPIRLALALAIILPSWALLSGTAQAGIVTFTDEAIWQATVGTFEVETFGSSATVSQETLTFPDSGIVSTYVPNLTPYSGQIHRLGLPSACLSAACFMANVTSVSPLYGVAVWDLGESLDAWGAYLNLLTPRGLTVEMYSGGTGGTLVASVNIDNLFGGSSRGFAGIVSDQAFNTIVWTADGGSAQSIIVDDFRYGYRAVPEPATLVLFGGGLLSLLGYGRRRKR